MITAEIIAAAASGGFVTPLIIGILGSGGFVGAIVALVKLRGDTQSNAVAQAQGANEAMSETLIAVERERDYWKSKWVETHNEKNDLYAEMAHLRAELRRLRSDDTGRN